MAWSDQYGNLPKILVLKHSRKMVRSPFVTASRQEHEDYLLLKQKSATKQTIYLEIALAYFSGIMPSPLLCTKRKEAK